MSQLKRCRFLYPKMTSIFWLLAVLLLAVVILTPFLLGGLIKIILKNEVLHQDAPFESTLEEHLDFHILNVHNFNMSIINACLFSYIMT